MSKTLILSEKQLNEVLDGNVDYFADETSYASKGNNEVMVTPVMDKHKNPTGDEIAKQMGKRSAYFGRGSNDNTNRIYAQLSEVTLTKKEFEELDEVNQALNNIHMSTVDSNGKVISGNESDLAFHKTMAKQRGDKDTYNAISKTLKVRRDLAKRRKETNKKLGLPNNQYHQAPKRLGGMNKNNNITYFE